LQRKGPKDATPPPGFAPPRTLYTDSGTATPKLENQIHKIGTVNLEDSPSNFRPSDPPMHDHHHLDPSPRLRQPNGHTKPRPASMAPTTATNVAHMVADSKFHDEALCELLEAAKLNLIGKEAKKALRRAAKARVIELQDLRESVGILGDVS
jgi:hypothetical protein